MTAKFAHYVTAYRGNGNGWTWEFLTTREEVLDLAFSNSALPLSTVYERTFLCP